jgi:hypothetical protein
LNLTTRRFSAVNKCKCKDLPLVNVTLKFKRNRNIYMFSDLVKDVSNIYKLISSTADTAPQHTSVLFASFSTVAGGQLTQFLLLD